MGHKPVLVQEVLEKLAIKESGIYVDATFGRGGHAGAIMGKLGSQGRLIAMDKDPQAVESARTQFAEDDRFSVTQGSFANIKEVVNKHNVVGNVDGILLDLGVSSPQLEDPQRGFSFMRDGPLDMRMDSSAGMGAATWLNAAKQQEIAQVLKDFGEERYAKRIAAAIVQQRSQRSIQTTGQLVALIKRANPSKEKHKHPATRTFQAIRIFINHELDDLQQCLLQCVPILKVGGRLCVISFHSLEDRIVKKFIQKQIQGDLPVDLPIKHREIRRYLKKVGPAIKPTMAEIESNPRSRSAVLRVAEKL